MFFPLASLCASTLDLLLLSESGISSSFIFIAAACRGAREKPNSTREEHRHPPQPQTLISRFSVLSLFNSFFRASSIALIMSRRRASHSEPANEAPTYPFASSQTPPSAPRRGPIEGPNGRRLIRRVTWRSSTYKLMASLWVLGVLYILWLIRDLFYLPFGPVESDPRDYANE